VNWKPRITIDRWVSGGVGTIPIHINTTITINYHKEIKKNIVNINI